MKKYLLIVLTFVLMLSACGRRSGEKNADKSFPFVPVPSLLTDPQETEGYIIDHFWDRFFDPERKYSRDSTTIGGVDRAAFLKAFEEYASNLRFVEVPKALAAQTRLMEQAEATEKRDTLDNVWDNICELCNSFFYDPNSPLRNEEFYIPVLEKYLETPYRSEEMKMAARYQLPLCRLNRLDTPAADFEYALPNGKRGRLYDLEADYILLFFSNPGCDACKDIVDFLKRCPALPEFIKQGNIVVLNVYPDADLEEWKAYRSNYPEEWINAYDPNLVLHSNTIYSLRAIPSVYVLDNAKRVIMKDAPIQDAAMGLGIY
ncbi:MAG: DUF5106 domain-containing protein [Bacteroidales bacterium]|nr:DUF5106 domain-containing protein [Bacteroidales bacterium]